MFNILDFIDSKEIREYNCTTKFTPIEQAVLIFHSERTTVDEKMAAWQELFDTYSEEEFEWTRYGKRRFDDKSNKQILADAITVYENALNQRSVVGKVIFEASFYECDCPKSKYPVFFSSYKDAFLYIEDKKKHYLEDEDLRKCQTKAKISLKNLGTHDSEDTIFYFDNEMRMTNIAPGRKCYEPDLYWIGELFVYVPLPFKKGDIIRSILPGRIEYGILDSTLDEEYFARAMEHGDWSDMEVSIYSYEPDEGIGYFDYARMEPLHYEKCPDEELPEDLFMLFLLRDVYQEKMSVAQLLEYYSKFGRKAYEHIYGRKKNTHKE